MAANHSRVNWACMSEVDVIAYALTIAALALTVLSAACGRPAIGRWSRAAILAGCR